MVEAVGEGGSGGFTRGGGGLQVGFSAVWGPVAGDRSAGRGHWALLKHHGHSQRKKMPGSSSRPLDEMFDEDPRAQIWGVGSRNQHPGMQ